MGDSNSEAPVCTDHGNDDACEGDVFTLCGAHYGDRLATAERIARDQGAANERVRIAGLLRERAASAFMKRDEEKARLYRDLATEIQKGGT